MKKHQNIQSFTFVLFKQNQSQLDFAFFDKSVEISFNAKILVIASKDRRSSLFSKFVRLQSPLMLTDLD